MQIAIIGSGYVGLVSRACLADFGHNEICVDKDAEKISALKQGECPIFEPGLADLIGVTGAQVACPLPQALTVRGARITSSTRIAVSIRMSNVRPHVQETADFAREIHSQRMALRGNRKGVFGATISKPAVPSASRPSDARISNALMTIRSIC